MTSNPDAEKDTMLVQRWLAASEATDKAKSVYEDACRDKARAAEALVSWIVPADAEEGEKFCIWCGEKLTSHIAGRHAASPQPADSPNVVIGMIQLEVTGADPAYSKQGRVSLRKRYG